MVTKANTITRGSFAERLRTLRKARGFRTAKSFAEVLAIDQNTYTRYERGEVEPNLAVLSRIWDLLDLPRNTLIGGEDGRPDAVVETSAGLNGRGPAAVMRYATSPPASMMASGPVPGFADSGPATGYGDTPSHEPARTRLSLIEAKAWRLAQLIATSGVGLDANERKSSLAIVRETVVHFKALSTAPFETISKFSTDRALDAADGQQRDMIAQQLSEFAALIAEEMIGV